MLTAHGCDANWVYGHTIPTAARPSAMPITQTHGQMRAVSYVWSLTGSVAASGVRWGTLLTLGTLLDPGRGWGLIVVEGTGPLEA